jgi:hypothetical protein
MTLAVGDHLVRLTEEDGGWTLQVLAQPADIVMECYDHKIRPHRLQDGRDVLQCVRCRKAW